MGNRYRIFTVIKFFRRLCKIFPFIEPYIYKWIRHKARRSKGEILVAEWLNNNNIKFKQEYLVRFPFLVKKKPFVFINFYLPDYNIFIEYNGRQHYEYVPYFHKHEDYFLRQQIRDNVVRSYCKENNIQLIEIPYYLSKSEIFEYLNESVNKSRQ